MTPRQRTLGVLAVLLVVVALTGIGATLFGWEPFGPPALPVNPGLASPPGATFIRDQGDFDVHGSSFRALLYGSPGHYEVVIVHTAGSGGRVAALEGANASVDPNGALDVYVGETNVTLRTYREAWLGVWRTEPLTLQFNDTR